MQNNDEFWRASRNVTLVGSAIDGLLGIAKIIVGGFAHSHSLVADGVHSLSDLVSDFMVLAITRFSRSSPDEGHPYGHARFETLATVVLGGFLFAVAAGLAYENITRFLSDEALPIPTWPALIVAAISIASKEWIFHYTKRVAITWKSDLLLANAWHSRSDAFSSIIVFIGVAGSMWGIVWMDVAAALIVAAIIAKIAFNFIWDNVRQLVDEGLSVKDQKKIKQLAREVEGVINVHDLRSRLMGADAYIEVHIEVDPWISVSEGHYIGNVVCERIRKHMPAVSDIVFHIDTEHKDGPKHSPLPSRATFIESLKDKQPTLWQLLKEQKSQLHFINDKLSVDVFCRDVSAEQLAQANQEANILLKQKNWLEKINLWT